MTTVEELLYREGPTQRSRIHFSGVLVSAMSMSVTLMEVIEL